MVVANNKVVSVTYELRKNSADGEVIEIVKDDNPLVYIAGMGSLLPDFEANLMGKKLNESFTFSIPADDAYGPREESAIIDLPLQVFMVDGEVDYELVRTGQTIPMRDQDGNRLNGIVLDVNETTVKMDFNHPLAGDDLYFTGKIVGIRDATQEELEHGHVHGHGGHSHDEED
ncbi:MAG TPA: FKBP-type peptidyl-prolyl cis-trans isomerase [Bacteroidales bacterium]|nr:peptidylprolyl isomerase [Bacteroidales bacterium]HQK36112.1 FKBP-type peptidyl-prolyl cis-trans isomerase [Bacteroidales bacterium]